MAPVNAEHTLALALRFGGSRIARLAAQQALQTVQAHAQGSKDLADEGTLPSSSETASGGDSLEGPPHSPVPPPAAAPSQAASPEAGDEALLLSDLLNTAAAAGAGRQEGLLRRLGGRPLPCAQAAPPAAAAVGQPPEADRADRGSYSDEFSTERMAEEEEGADCSRRSATLPAAGSPPSRGGAASPVVPGQLALLDAEEQDTVLTGSPIIGHATTPDGSRGSVSSGPGSLCSVGGAVNEIGAEAACSQEGRAEVPATTPASHRPAGQQPRQPARKPEASGKPAKEAVRQRVWSFAAIPQGHASIPSKADATPRSSAAAIPGGGRPAFYTRAGSPRPPAAAPPPLRAGRKAARPSSARQTTAGPGAAPPGVERLAQPKHAPAARRPPTTGGTRAKLAVGDTQPASHAPPASVMGATQAGHSGANRAKQPRPDSSNQPGEDGISAWRRPGPAAAAAATTLQSPRQQQPQQQPASSISKPWPQQLGQQLSGTELQRATGAYSEERFQQHLSKLAAALAARQQLRGRTADAAVAGVGVFVERVQRLGTGSLATSCHSDVHAGAQCVAPATPCQAPAGDQPDQQPSPGAQQLTAGGDAGSPSVADQQPGPKALPQSLTERLLHCQQRLQGRRPQTAPLAGGVSPWHEQQQQQQRPATSSPGKVKSLMQVKGEQERALQELRQQPHRFRASPLPLSTMEPRFERQQAQQAAARHEAQEQRRRQLLEQQRPFPSEAREAERRQWRVSQHWDPAGGESAAGAGGDAAAGARPKMPAPPHAQPVPVSTTEARYALLVAELQLQHRTVRGRQLASPPRRLATAPHAVPACNRAPAIRPATSAQTTAALAEARLSADAVQPLDGSAGRESPGPPSGSSAGEAAARRPSSHCHGSGAASPAGHGIVAADGASSTAEQQVAGTVQLGASELPPQTLHAETAEQEGMEAAGASAAGASRYSTFDSESVSGSVDVAAGSEVTQLSSASKGVCKVEAEPPALGMVAADSEAGVLPAGDEAQAQAAEQQQGPPPSEPPSGGSPVSVRGASEQQPVLLPAAAAACQPSLEEAEEKVQASRGPSSPAVQRLGSRSEHGALAQPGQLPDPAAHVLPPLASSTCIQPGSPHTSSGTAPAGAGQAACSEEAGIAVPLRFLAGASGCLPLPRPAPGTGSRYVCAELLAEGSAGEDAEAPALPADGLATADCVGDTVSQCGASVGSAETATRQPRRRDTPLQHIAARHRQAEAAARREVRSLLQGR